jgi:histidinol-phosphate aminotransferase
MNPARNVIAAMTAYTLELREAEVKLNQNESPFDVPMEIKEEVLGRLAKRAWNIYPDFESQMLREAIAKSYGFRADEILVGNGSNELLAAAIGAVVGPRTPVIFPRPTFTLYEKLVTIAGGLPVPVEFDPAAGELPLDEMLERADEYDDAVIIVCSPNNPTGSVLREGGLQKLLATGRTVLYDRAYGDFNGSEPPPLDDRLLTFSTFSKAWGLAALRVGWMASTASTCREVRKVKLPYSLNVMSETIAAVMLEHSDFRDANVECIVEERDRVTESLRSIESLTIFPSEANFVSFRVGGSAKDVFESLHRDGILIRDVSSYPRMKNCLRVTIGTREQNDRFLASLRNALRKVAA